MTADADLHPHERPDAAADSSAPPPARVDRYRALFDDAADAMLILDDHRVISDANRAAGVLLGEPPGDLVGQTLEVFLPREEREQLDTCWRELLAFGEGKREHRLQTRHHGVRLVECSYRARPFRVAGTCASRATSRIAACWKAGWCTRSGSRASAGSREG